MSEAAFTLMHCVKHMKKRRMTDISLVHGFQDYLFITWTICKCHYDCCITSPTINIGNIILVSSAKNHTWHNRRSMWQNICHTNRKLVSGWGIAIVWRMRNTLMVTNGNKKNEENRQWIVNICSVFFQKPQTSSTDCFWQYLVSKISFLHYAQGTKVYKRSIHSWFSRRLILFPLLSTTP